MAKRNAPRKYVPALDGLRALAVLTVIAYHMNMSWAPGGLLGVTMFFVLSGYLITGLLLREYARTGTISLKGFWMRRVRRIIPAVVFAVLGIALLCTLFNHVLLTKMRPDVAPTLFFFNNWWQIIHDVSYFEAMGQPSPLTHFWSLSIEEQFYVVWPLLLLGCMKAGVPRSKMMIGTAVLALLSVLEMAFMFDPAGDPSRVYYGTDTRAFSLLIGSLLAFIWPFQLLTEKASAAMPKATKVSLNVVGFAALIGLLVMVGVVNGVSAFMYRGGLLLCSLLTAVLIAMLVHPASLLGRVFATKPMVLVGKWSYSMYLWHFPVILLMTPANPVGGAPIWLRLIQLGVIVGISAFSYYAIEEPIRRGAVGNFVGSIVSRSETLGSAVRARVVPLALGAVFICSSVMGCALVPDEYIQTNLSEEAEEQDIPSSDDPYTEALKQLAPYDVLLIGDSISEGIAGYGAFPAIIPYGHIDGLRNRELADCFSIYQSYADVNAVGDIVVFDIGTNGSIEEGLLEELIELVGQDKHLFFVNIALDTSVAQLSNETLAKAAEKHANVEVIDWLSLSQSLGEAEFWEDGIHLTEGGAFDYVWMIHDEIEDLLPEHKDGDKTRDELIEELKREFGKGESGASGNAPASSGSADAGASSGEDGADNSDDGAGSEAE